MLKNKLIAKRIRNIFILIMTIAIMMGAYHNVRRSRAEKVIEISLEVADKNNQLEKETITVEATETSDGVYLLELPEIVNTKMITKYYNSEDEEIDSRTIQLTDKEIAEKKVQVATDYDTKDGTCVRDYIHVTDLAQAHILAVKYLMEGNESNIFNLGNGVGFTVKEVIETARKVTGKPIKAVEEGRRAGDPAVLIASSEKAKNILGWKPEHADLEEIIASAWKWHSSHPQGYCSVQKEDK